MQMGLTRAVGRVVEAGGHDPALGDRPPGSAAPHGQKALQLVDHVVHRGPMGGWSLLAAGCQAASNDTDLGAASVRSQPARRRAGFHAGRKPAAIGVATAQEPDQVGVRDLPSRPEQADGPWPIHRPGPCPRK